MIENLLRNPDAYLHGAFYMAVLAAYLGGVLASFTPCVYPVIPVTVAYIGARSSSSRTKGFLLSIIYVLGMAAVYTALGGFAALTGKLFGQFQTNPWVFLIIANICIIMGLSMLGVFMLSIPMPQFLTGFRPKEKSGGFVGSFLVGAVSGIIIGPCTTPVLAVLLSLIAARQSAVFGMSLMFVFAIGMGTLLVIVGTFSGILSRIPRSGVWMTRINKIFGWILIGMGEYFLLKAGGMLWL
ncbi:MAG: sulfite exporter TauE/SafE family protein [Deltaproteobacteria bacterium]|nr:sulfite exporter TauE/SafE family protein [Deltaproteobacteria bacterium]